MYGNYFLQYVQQQGHERLLKCLGNNLFEWLSNVNQVHNHLLYAMEKMKPPIIWYNFYYNIFIFMIIFFIQYNFCNIGAKKLIMRIQQHFCYIIKVFVEKNYFLLWLEL